MTGATGSAGCAPDGDAVRIRPATADDHAAIAGLQGTSFPDRWSLDSVRRIATLAGAVVLLAEREADGRPVGYLIGQVVTDEAEVHSLAVAATARRRGIGRRLLTAFEATVAGLGAGSVVLEVASDDPVATTLYESAGYEVVARRPGYYRIGRPQPVDAEVRRRSFR
ncbi:MAG: GNAT family N-acetyltransferase [Thalassobaculum sp.]